MRRLGLRFGMLVALCSGCLAAKAQAIPPSIAGMWRILKILPTHNDQCWNQERAQALVGTTLDYQPRTIVWAGGSEAITEALKRTLSRRKFQDEYKVELQELGVATASVVEFDLQHEDADVTGATTEVPGDTIVVAGPGKIVVSACGVFYAAVRVTVKSGNR